MKTMITSRAAEFKDKKRSEEREARMNHKKELKRVKNKDKSKVNPENKETDCEKKDETQDQNEFEPSITTFNAFDYLNTLDIATSSAISYDKEDNDDIKIDEVDNDAKVQEIYSKEEAIENLEPIEHNPCTSNSLLLSKTSNLNISTDQPTSCDEEFKANVTEMIRKYREDQDCNVS